jgi:tRNA 2-thiouridine synthesizing protein A
MSLKNSVSDQSIIEIDAKGLFCPEPVMMLHSKINEMNSLDSVLLLSTDPSTPRDVQRFCQFLGHELLSSEEIDGCFQLIIKKK